MTETKNLRWISFLRGLAAFLVFVSHLPRMHTVASEFITGRWGVTLFFLMMGYVSIDARNKRNAKQYLFNRFIRIYPIYWLLMTVNFIILHVTQNDGGGIGLLDWLLNLTLFNEFLGSDCIIGASWMLPMQVVYFFILGMFGTSIFKAAPWGPQRKYKTDTIMIAGLMILASITGAVRHVTGLPFPTAFFLLLAVGVIGAGIRLNGFRSRHLYCQLLVFETGLLVSAYLSYPGEVLNYVAAYNLGFVTFVLVGNHQGVHFAPLEHLSGIAYSFFLGAKIPIALIGNAVDFSETCFMTLVGWAVEFTTAVLFAIAVTKWIERPLQKWARQVERNLGK